MQVPCCCCYILRAWIRTTSDKKSLILSSSLSLPSFPSLLLPKQRKKSLASSKQQTNNPSAISRFFLSLLCIILCYSKSQSFCCSRSPLSLSPSSVSFFPSLLARSLARAHDQCPSGQRKKDPSSTDIPQQAIMRGVYTSTNTRTKLGRKTENIVFRRVAD
jgi:hypothetical protein